jgi:dihydrofolate synthase/folylpolyglutamate synthase
LNYREAIQYLYDLRWFGAKLGLTNTLKLAALAGNPQQQLRFIHVAGTNGKGSACAMLESIYRAAGLRVGLFTSPHLVAFGERIQVNRQPIPERDIVRLVEEMRSLMERGWGAVEHLAAHAAIPVHAAPAATAADAHPTFFEVVTVMALRYFAEQKCDLVIWETGLGGRLDATNIVTPLASVITNIEYDHQQWLGETLASIAAEKAGIIKPHTPVITGTEEPEALAVIKAAARENKAPLTLASPEYAIGPGLESLQLPLLGRHQRKNAAIAVATVRALTPVIAVAASQIRRGLESVDWPGRLQLVTKPSGQKILLDGAHNTAGARTLAEALAEYFPGVRPTLVLGILQDKDWLRICEFLAPLAGRILLAPVGSERSAAPQQLSEVCHRANPQVEVTICGSLAQALAAAESDRFVVVTGSLYLIGEAMEHLRLLPAATGERSLNEWGLANRSPAAGRASG